MNGAGFKPSSSCSEAQAVTQPLAWLCMRSLNFWKQGNLSHSVHQAGTGDAEKGPGCGAGA